ncbi:MAG: extracellular solute-binding protein [Candidatus Faecousia sp.]|nr:extracellular solute-binding protein [Candidatus Faecousia sp.]
MKKTTRTWLILLAAMLALSTLPGCGTRSAGQSEPITVYLWSTELYNGYAQYIQSHLPDVDIQFVVGNNDLDFYKFLSKNGALPDIITCRRFSLHDAADLHGYLMDLSSTQEAGAVYSTYLESFTNTEGEIQWLPLCGEVDGLLANRALFERYQIPMPSDYESFVAACQAFEAKGIRGFAADFAYDYTCMELLQGWFIPELTSLEGQVWRHRYEDPLDEMTGLDDTIWPGAFARMERFISDAKLRPEDIELDYDPVNDLFAEGKAAMIRAGGAETVRYNHAGIDAVFLPYFGPNGEQWLLTYPQFQVALNKNLEQDQTRQEQAMQVLEVMLSEGGQNALAKGEDVISYSQNVELTLDPALDNLRPYIQQNHLFIRLASNEFFSVSKDVVTKMILGEYDAQQAYKAFDTQLRADADAEPEILLTLEQGYSNTFRAKGGSQAASVMANTLRECFGSEVLIAPAYSFTGSVLKANYTQKMVGNMVMPNALMPYRCDLTGAQLKQVLKLYVEGVEGGFTPFNPGSLPVVSGLTMDVTKTDTGFVLTRVRRDGEEIRDSDTFHVTCLNTQVQMARFPKDVTQCFELGETGVKTAWIEYIKNGGTLAQPENYITLK